METRTPAVPSVMDEVKTIYKTAWELFTEQKAVNAIFVILLMALFCVPLKVEIDPACSPEGTAVFHNILVLGKLIYYLVVMSGLTIALPHIVISFIAYKAVHLFKVIAVVFLMYGIVFITATSLAFLLLK